MTRHSGDTGMERETTMERGVRRLALLGTLDTARLQEALSSRFDVQVQDEAGAAADAEVDALVTACASDVDLKAALLGPQGYLSRARAGLLLVDLSPVSEALSREIDEAAQRARVRYVRAPLTTGPGDGGGQIHTAMVSGAREDYERAFELLEALAGNIVWLGEGEEARAMTRVLDVMTGVSMAMWAEALVFGEAVGLDWREMLEVMQTSAIGSPVIQSHTPLVAARDFGSPIACEQMARRLGDALASGKATGTVLTLTGLAHQMYLGALGHGLAGEGLTAVIPWLESAAGTQPGDGRTGVR
jgi:3-hydroxyisobutyrate dehydrogenase-like beta-hydroxyacid dehydrogenase